MSASVLKPILYSELYTIRTPSTIRKALPTSGKLNQIKKDLFGPINSMECKKVITDELDRHQDIACRKWGFDFRKGYPLANHNQFIWHPVSFGEFIPEVYTLSRAAHVRQISTYEPTDRDLLMDERAARENSPSNRTKDFLQEFVANDSVLFKVPLAERLAAAATAASTSSSSSSISTPGKKQPKITDYMKERKRLAPTPKKLSPVKRLRTNSPLSIGGSSSSSNNTNRCN